MLLNSMLAFAKPAPIDPILILNEKSKFNHRISLSFIPEFSELTFSDGTHSHSYINRVNTFVLSNDNDYSLSEQITILGTLTYKAIFIKEYLNREFVANSKESQLNGNLGIRYDWFPQYINSSIEVRLGYPWQLTLSLFANLIRDPLIHSIGLSYRNNIATKTTQLALIQSLGFIANDKISLRFSTESIFSRELRPQINSITLTINYALDPEKKENIALNNTLLINNDNLNLNLGISYSF